MPIFSHPIACEAEYGCNDVAFDDFLEYEVDGYLNIQPMMEKPITPHPEIEEVDFVERPLRRCTSSIPEFGVIYPMDNEVVTKSRSFTYLDILPPPTHVQYKNKMHKICFNLDGRRYITHDGENILLRDIALMA